MSDTPASFFELTLLVPADQVDIASDTLLELDALSVAVEDADAGSSAEQPIFGEPSDPTPQPPAWPHSCIKALFNDENAPIAAAATLLAQPWGQRIRVKAIAAVDDQDWVRLTQSQFDPVEITPDFWIVPSWHLPPAQARHVIRLDPGLAFGTGTHPTTRMCLRWVATHEAFVQKQRILDYGCGSGILSIAAALFGASEIDAVDIDPAAVESTRLNAMANGVTLRTSLPDAVQGQYSIVMANILATPLKLLAPLLCAHLAPNAHLVLAGILKRQAQELQQAYAPWVKLEVCEMCDGWILMTAHKQP